MNTIEKILLFGAAPAVLLLALLEGIVLSRREHYDWRAYGVSLFDFVGRIAVTSAHRVHHAANLKYLGVKKCVDA